MIKRLAVAFLVLACSAASARAEFKPVQHPFMLWTKDEAAAIKKQIDAGEPWTKTALERSLADNNPFTRLFRYAVLGDQKAGDEERKFLLSFIGAPVNNRRWSTNYLTALRYDVLYDTLTDDQRAKLQATFRQHIQHELDNPYINTQTSWLPNMQMPRIMSANIMAVALQDEKLIDAAWRMPSSYKYYMDDYLADGGLYFEEFAKMTSLIGEFLLYARGLERLGLNDKGFGYTGKKGATLRNYIESYVWFGYPRTEIPGGMPRYERVAMGDARGHHLGLFQHANVGGALPPQAAADSEKMFNMSRNLGSWSLWYAANMNGRDHRDNKVTKMQFPQWFEFMHVRDKGDGPWAYFLAQMREPNDKAYIPTLFWGASPIDPATVKPPAAPSQIFPVRGFALLRAEESSAYWTSPAPAVSLQFAQLYVHYTADCFSLLGYHAFNRPIYLNRCISAGYNGGPWDFHVRGHAGVVVDNLQAQPLGVVETRHNFAPEMKYVHVNSKVLQGLKGKGEVRSSDQPKVAEREIYPGVQMTRSLMLTREYLFDAFHLRSEKERTYHWLVHAPGVLVDNAGEFAPTTELSKTLMNVPEISPTKQWLRDQKKMDFALTLRQDCILPDVAQSQLGKAWYDRQVGVKIHALGNDADTRAFAFETPTHYTPGHPRSPKAGEEPKAPETGGISIAFERVAANTNFFVLHEPYEKNTPQIKKFIRIWQSDSAVGVQVHGPDYTDYVFLNFAAEPKPQRVVHNDLAFTFTSHAYVRIQKDTLTLRGDVEAVEKLPTVRKTLINGKEK